MRPTQLSLVLAFALLGCDAGTITVDGDVQNADTAPTDVFSELPGMKPGTGTETPTPGTEPGIPSDGEEADPSESELADIAELEALLEAGAQPGELVDNLESAPTPEGGARPADETSNIVEGKFVVSLSESGAAALQSLRDQTAGDQEAAFLDELSWLLDARPDLVDPSTDAVAPGEAISFESSLDSDEIQSTMEASSMTNWSEPVFELTSNALPNDEYYADHQWNMHGLGLEYPWSRVGQGEDVIVAVIDTASALVGEDAPVNVLPGINLVDDGEIPDFMEEYFPFLDAWSGHGAHVAGTIAQATNNGIGVSGIAPDATILPIRVLDRFGRGTTDVIAQGIRLAVEEGADIINMSLGGSGQSVVLQEACEFAHENGVLVVASSGNNGFEDYILQPAVFPTTIAVGATSMGWSYHHQFGYVAPYSNKGPELDIVAPGGTGTDMDEDGYLDGVVQERCQLGKDYLCGYLFFTGTSMAAPHVSGVAALLHSHGITDPDDLREVLTASANDWGYGWKAESGFGHLDVMSALYYAGIY